MLNLRKLRQKLKRKPQRIGVALAGGGARGLAHIGVLRVLEQNDIRVAQLAGTSAGAIVAAMYAAKPDAQWVERRMREFLDSDVYAALGIDRLLAGKTGSAMGRRLRRHLAVNLSLIRSHIVPRDKLEAAIEYLMPVREFSALERPLTVCAVDLDHGRVINHATGDLIEAVCDSAAIPGVFELRREHDTGPLIADGGVLAPVPVHALELCDYRIASDVNHGALNVLNAAEETIFGLMTRAARLAQARLANMQANKADLTIGPRVGHVDWAEFRQIDTLMAAGQEATRVSLRVMKDQV